MNIRKSIAAALIYGALVWLLLPSGVIAFNDDFGYLRSVVETIQRARPWTNDFLEPWSASFSLLAAGLFSLTGHFSFAVQGLLAALAVAAFAGISLLLHQRGIQGKRAWVLAAIALTFPTALWKAAEFTGVALYFPCLLLALWAAAERRWLCFLGIWSLAVASRQSAIVWLAIPLWSVAQNLGKIRTTGTARGSWAKPLLVLAAGVTIFWVLRTGMNRTHAQTLLTEGVFSRLNFYDGLRVFGVGLFVYLCAAGCGGLLLDGNASGRSRRDRLAPGAKLIGVGAIFIALLAIDERRWVQQEHTLFAGAMGWIYTKLILALAAAGWLTPRLRLRWDHLFFASASLVLLVLRGALWDYYLLDLAVLGFFGMTSPAEPNATPQAAAPSSVPGWPLALLASFHVLFFLDLKSTLDRHRALCLLSENALRRGQLQPSELSFAPFGFTAWHLFPYYAAHDGKNSADLGGFRRYLRPGAVEVGQGYSRMLHVFPRFRHEPPADRHNLIASGRYDYLWFFKADFFLLRFKTEGEQSAEVRLPETEVPLLPPFPLDDGEWRQLIASPRHP